MPQSPDKTPKPRGAPLAGYYSESARPLVSLVFVAPMLLIYEGGILFWPDAMRNGAEAWLRHLLRTAHFGQYFLLPLLTCGLLLAWHHTTHERWRFSASLLRGMLIESIVFGLLLLIVAGGLFHWLVAFVPCQTPVPPEGAPIMSRLIGYLGAGLYEELLFRLMLLPTVAFAIRLFGVKRRASLIAAVIVTSLVFSAAHYQLFTSIGEPFAWGTFLFRFIAGVFFSVLFVYRGFGITAGSHAFYDILTELL